MQATRLGFQQPQNRRTRNRRRALMSRFFALIAAMCINSAANAQNPEINASGTYISQSSNSAELVQIVITSDGVLAGRMESAQFDQSGQIETSSAPIEGAANGEHITFTPKSILLNLGAAPNFSGTISGDTLDLAWQDGRRLFRRGNADEFQAAIAQLRLRSASVIRANTAAQAAEQFRQLTLIADTLDQNLPVVRAQFASAANSYRALFDRIHNRRRAQAIHSAVPDQGLAAMRAGTDAQGIGLEINALTRDITNFRRQIDGEFERAETLNRSLTGFCGSAAATEPASPCAGVPPQASRVLDLKAAYETEFMALSAVYEEASVDVPPGRQLLENLLR